MKKIIVVRHGDYNARGSLTTTGERQISELACKIAAVTNPNETELVSSVSTRATDSAAIIMRTLGIGRYRTENILYSSEQCAPKHNEVIDQIIIPRRDAVGTLIIVTHFEYTSFLPTIIGCRMFDKAVCFQEIDIDKGQARVIDFDLKQAYVL